MESDDDGATWSTPRDISAQAKGGDWTWYATGPGVGIQLTNGTLLIPCDHYDRMDRLSYSHVILSQITALPGSPGERSVPG